jgi:hypothetical protein
VRLWEQAAARPRNQQLYPFVELAKFHERVSKDLDRAVQAARDGLALLERRSSRLGTAGGAERGEMLRRIERLERRRRALGAEG